MAKIPKEDKRILVMKDQMERAILEALGVGSKQALPVDMQILVDQIIDGLEPMTALFTRGNAPKGSNIVAVLHNGKPSYYEVIDPLLYRSLVALNRPMRGAWIKWLGMPKRVGQLAVTLTFDFIVRNLFRDTLTGAIMSRHGFKPFVDSARGFASRIMRDPNYREFIANGGGLGSHLLDETAYREHLERFITRKGIDYRTVLDAPDKLWFAVNRIAEAFEQSTRLGEFRQAIARGEHPRHAAYSAREVGTDFAMRGDNQYVGFLYDTVIFLKAAVNSIDRLARRVRGREPPQDRPLHRRLGYRLNGSLCLEPQQPPLRTARRLGQGWILASVRSNGGLLAARARGEEIAPEDAYQYSLRLPKLWEIGAVSSVAERQLEGILSGQPGEAQLKSLNVLRQQFNVGLPQFAEPPIELAINRDLFTGRPIETGPTRACCRSRAMTPVRRRLCSASPNWNARCRRSCKSRRRRCSISLEATSIHGPPTAWASPIGHRLRVCRPATGFPAGGQHVLCQEPARSTHYVSDLYDAIQAATEARRTMKAMQRRYKPEMRRNRPSGRRTCNTGC